MEIRAIQETENNEMIVEGYALRFNEPTVLWEGADGTKYNEVIERSALDNADISDVSFKYNHSDNVMIMARTKSGTLQLLRDDEGLFIRANLANTTSGRDLHELIKRGDIDKMSFAFKVEEDEYDLRSKTRIIKRFKKLYDVAAVDVPAYDTTSISARAYFEEEAQKEVEALKNTELRKKLLIKTYL